MIFSGRRLGLAAVLGFACNIAFSLLLMGPMGTSGIALANSRHDPWLKTA